MSLSHSNLGTYYKTNFGLMQHHNYSLTEIENMLPWERDIYVGMLIDYLEKKKQRESKSHG
jgi:hypothetical protein